ncbi:AAA-ATPase [Streptomyces phage Gilgamesh]|uniref:AAA-ATPase n=1 Tax=Streptomyces phage Gilgamesh TaxID=2599890 RepID=A0A5J6TTS2_9CAUD|nr:AAA-ATPase [Streptomyces phage Gilgamesh]QFG13269.1 AAA-ATPase [Streptomyces phage Gilgamesh]
MPGITAPQRARSSRRPTGLPNPPMILLAGPEKTGKSRLAAEGTASELIGMTYWIEIGGSEGTADYYGRLPGANYEIVNHDGSYQDILDAVRWAVAQPPAIEGKRNMIVLDNVSVLWDMLSDEQALYARWRAEKKAQENRRRGPNPDLPITVDPDLWNRAKDRWGEILWLLRRHTGPTVLLARQELVVAFENDKPTREKTRKIKAEKNLPSAVDAIVELHALGEAYLTGVRTLHWEVTPGQSERFEDFSIDALLRRMGFAEAAPARQVTETRPEAYLDEQQAQRQQPQQQRQTTPQQGNQPPLTGDQAVELIRNALSDETDPEMCLQGLREEWGIRTLRQIRTHTQQWGAMSADDLISRSLAYAKERAEWKRQQAAQQQKEQPNEQPTGSATPPPGQPAPEEAREHQAHAEPDPPAEDDAPPPPDPQAEEPPPNESPEDTSAAEEPQDVPPAAARPAPTPAATRQNRKVALALKALNAEADVQARLRMMTVGEHLGPISEDGDPSMTVLRDYLQQHRPALIAQLESEGHTELASYYRDAPVVEPQIQQRFAAYFEGVPAGQK